MILFYFDYIFQGYFLNMNIIFIVQFSGGWIALYFAGNPTLHNYIYPMVRP